MPILDKKELEIIENQSKRMLPDRQKYENYRVFLCALRIINIVLGPEWYHKSSTGFVNSKGLRTLDTTKSHPISKLLKDGDPILIYPLVKFANFIQNLYDGPDFISKIQKYVKDEKYSEITFEKFQSTLFEFRVACHHKFNNLKVEFVRERDIPSPDLKIISKNDYAFLECKRKQPRDDFSLSSILNTISKTHDKQLVPRDKPGIIAINLSLKETVYKFHLDEILGSILMLIKDLPLVNFVEVYNEHVHHRGSSVVFEINRQNIENPNPIYGLSDEIIDVALYSKKIPYMLPFKSTAPM